MARTVTQIRDDIERAVAKRADLFRRQQACGWTPDAETMRDERAGIEASLHYLWEELRAARVEPLRRGGLTGAEAFAISRAIPRMAVAR